MEEKLESIIVVKRDGKRVAFDGTKVAIAIKKGFDSIEGKYSNEDINKVYNRVIEKIANNDKDKIKIEEIQDLIEQQLKECGYEDVYKSFSEYREKRNQSREIFFEKKRKHKFLKTLEKLGLNTKEVSDTVIDTRNAMDTVKAYGITVSGEFTTSYLMKKKFSNEHENGDIYINNLEFYPTGTTESLQINFEKLFSEGFSTENSSMREPQSIMSYAMLAIIALSQIQKDQCGEQGIPAFDYYMAPGVLKSFKKEFKQTIYDILEYTDYDKFIAINGIEREIEKINTIDFNIEEFYKFTRGAEELKRMFRIVYAKALEKTEKLVYQSVEAFVHDLNSVCNSNLTTVNLGTDTSAEGRMVTRNFLLAIEEGVGEGKEAISPITVFKVKRGVNFEQASPNHDLLEQACKLVEKNRKITFSNLDAQYNAQYYKEGDFDTEVAYLRNGSRVIDNVVDKDKEVTSGRGILSSTTINLPRIALKHRDNIDDFFVELEEKIELVKDQLLERMDIQGNKKVFNFPFVMKENVWIDSEKLKIDDKVKKVLKQGALRVSFLGLNECLIVLTGKSHKESKTANELGIKIITKMRDKLDEFSKKYNLTFILGGEYNEEIAKELIEFDKIIFGKIKNVTDKEKYSQAFNVEDELDESKKMKIEGLYHELTNGGHITEVYSSNVLDTIKDMQKNEIGYIKVKYKA